MSTNFSGSYPIDDRSGEIERLHAQGEAFAPDTAIMLDRIGVRPGWSCLDMGCGPRGVTDLMSARVGSGGRVVGIDMNEQFLAHARAHAAANTEFRRADAFASGLPDGAFDLVHSRFVASTSGNADRLLREAVRLARPGGFVAFQEPDVETYKVYPPDPAWQRLYDAMLDVFASVGADIYLARKLYAMSRDAGLADVHYRPVLLGIRSTDPMIEHLPATVESIRGAILKRGLISEAELPDLLDRCRRHLRNPAVVSRSFMVAQVWGRKPG